VPIGEEAGWAPELVAILDFARSNLNLSFFQSKTNKILWLLAASKLYQLSDHHWLANFNAKFCG
jgi:hypothetical protein